jgi:Methyltransferase domain
VRFPARRELDRLQGVTAERPYRFRPGRWGRLRGLALIPTKAILRRLMRWYVEPLASEQREFNAGVLRLADELSEHFEQRLELLEQWNIDRIEQINELSQQQDHATARAGERSPGVEHELNWLAPAKVTAAAAALALIDVSPHNAAASCPTFDEVVSQVVSASQFSHPDFERLQGMLFPGEALATVSMPHRKVWEDVYVMRAAEQHGILEPGRRAVGFGVGQEPIPAALAQAGLTVLATDLDVTEEASAAWAAAAQHMSNLRSLDTVPDDVLEGQVSTRYVDMNSVPDDLGRFDLVWSCCALEHLGSPEAGLEFVVRTLDLLEPGGVSVHTTELELTPRSETADYGNLAIYRKADLDRLVERVRSLGFEIQPNWYVSLDTPADRWISLPPHNDGDLAHLKLGVGDSVSTSVGLLIRRPVASSAPF